MAVVAYSTRNTEIPLVIADQTVISRPLILDGSVDLGLRNEISEKIAAIQTATQTGQKAEPAELIRHLQDTKRVYEIAADESARQQIAEWAKKSNSILYYAGNFFDPSWQPLLPTRDQPATGHVPYCDQAISRANTWRAILLRKLNLFTPPTSPPVRSEDEVNPRPASDIAKRISALTLTCDLANAILTKQQINIAAMRVDRPAGFSALNGDELRLYETDDPQLAEKLICNVEMLAELLWTIGLDEQPGINKPSELAKVLNRVYSFSEAELIENATLQPLEALLDEYERLNSTRFALSDIKIGGSVMADIDPEVIELRLKALDWLVDSTTDSNCTTRPKAS